jgi:hypothetical protein
LATAATMNMGTTGSLEVTGNITFAEPSTGTNQIDVEDGSLTCDGSIFLTAGATANKYCELALNNGTIDAVNIVSGGLNSKLTFTGTGTVNVSGNFMTGQQGTLTPGNGTVVLDGEEQYVGASNILYTFNNLTLAGSETKTFPAWYNNNTVKTIINGLLSLEGDAIAALGNPSHPIVYGSGAGIKYNRSGSLDINAGVIWLSTFSGSQGITIAGAPIVIDGNKVISDGVPLVISSGGQLKVNNYYLTTGGDITIDGFLYLENTINLTGSNDQCIHGYIVGGNIVCNKSAGTATLSSGNQCSVDNISISAGTLYLGSYNNSGTTINISGGTLNAGTSYMSIDQLIKTGGTFNADTGTVRLRRPNLNTDLSIVDFYNLELTNSNAHTSGYGTNNDIALEGNLVLSGPNPSGTSALLNMGSYTLTLGPNSQVTGEGDVQGIVTRTSFQAGNSYTFSNAYTSISFPPSGVTLPTSMSVKTTIGSASSGNSSTVLRYFDIIQTGGSGDITMRAHYDEDNNNELNSNSEPSLSFWTYESSTYTEVGKTGFSFDNNWIEITNYALSNFSSSFGSTEIDLIESNTLTYVWEGGTSTNWNEATNWIPVGIPGSANNVIIPNDQQSTPVVDNVTILSLNLEDAVYVDVDYNITIAGGNGAWNDPGGRYVADGHSVTFTNSEATISGQTEFYDLIIDDNAKVQMLQDADIIITNSFTVSANNGDFDATSWSNTITFDGSGSTVVMPSAVTDYYNLNLNESVTMPSANLVVENDMNFMGNVAASLQGNLTTKGTMTIEYGSALTTNNNQITFGGDFVNANPSTFDAASSNIVFDLTNDQTIDPFTSGGTMTMTKTGGTVSFDGGIEAGGIVLNGNGGTMDLGGNYYTINGSVVLNNGSLLGESSEIELTTGGASHQTWQGNGSLFDPGTSIVYFMGDDYQSITATNSEFYYLYMEGSGVKNIASNTTVETDFENYSEVTNNAPFTVGGVFYSEGDFTSNAYIYLNGDFEFYADFTANSGSRVVFNAPDNEQYVYFDYENDFHDVQVNNSGELALENSIWVKGHLYLTDGYIIPSDPSYKVVISNTGTSDPGSSSSFVDGTVVKKGSSDFIFPTGDLDGLHGGPMLGKIGISSLSGSETFSATYYNEGYSNVEDVFDVFKVAQYEYWDLSPVGSTTARVTLYWEDNDASYINNESDLRIGHWNSTEGYWENLTDNNTTSGTFAENSHGSGSIRGEIEVSNFSPFTYASKYPEGNPLPIDLVDFRVECGNEMNEVSWQTASEVNSKVIILEGSEDGTNWESRSTVNAQGTSNTLTDYAVNDYVANNPVKYYRLKMVDNDGTYKYSSIILVSCADQIIEKSISVYPNPAVNETSITLSESLMGSKLAIYNSIGQIVFEKLVDNLTERLDLSYFSKGVYYVKVHASDNEVLNQKFIVE